MNAVPQPGGIGRERDGSSPALRVEGKPAAFNLADRLAQHRADQSRISWEGSFLDYYGKVSQNPGIARLSHARVYDMIMAGGVTDQGKDEPKKHGFFADELYGIDRPLEQVVDYFASAARRLEVRKRILLLMGPVGGGKSTIVTMLKRGLEAYSHTDAGEVYAIKDCPMWEEPLHLLPEVLRKEVGKEQGIHIEGDLCPKCRVMVEDRSGKIDDVPVVRYTMSEKERRSIGTFAPSDPKSQDISELTGSVDLATIGKYGAESDARAYRFDGELNVANRGLMEFVEMLKCDEKFLYNLLTLSQEQNIKTGRFAMIYADEVVISHTNEHEYAAFIANKKSEALHDRIIVVKVPYNLKISEEAKIYQKMLDQTGNMAIGRSPQPGEIHVAPQTLELASLFAVTSRLEPSKKAGMTLVKKAKLYDGRDVAEATDKDAKELRKEAEDTREGMQGVSPRYVTNALSHALVKDGAAACINPIDALRALRDNLDQAPGMDKDRKAAMLELLAAARAEFDDTAKIEVQKAFVHAYEDSAVTLMNNYLDNAEAFKNKTKLRDPITDEEIDPDETLMRSIEEQIAVSEAAKTGFREEILIRVASLARRGLSFDYTSHERLREAIEKKLFADMKDLVKVTTSTKTPDAEQQKRMGEVTDRLVSDHGYCKCCAPELLKYVGTLLSR